MATLNDEKREIVSVSDYNCTNRWNLLNALAESKNDRRVNRNEKEQLNDLLQYVENIQYFQNQNRTLSTVFSDRSDKEYDIKWCPLLNVIFLICISSFIFGYITIQTASIINDTEGHRGLLYYKFKHMHYVEKSIISSSSLIGAAIGSLLIFIYSSCTTITYTFSRKRILILSNFPVICGGLIAILAEWTSSWLLVAGFILQGIGVGISSIIAPILIAELSPTPVRAFLTWFSQLFITFGMLISSLISWSMMNVKYGWIFMVFIGTIPAMIQFLFRKHIKPSPRLLIGTFHKLNRKYSLNNDACDICAEAMKVIQSFYVNKKDAKREYESISRHLINNENTCLNNRGILLTLISRLSDDSVENVNFKRSIYVGIFMNIMQQLTGANVIFYNIQTIVKHMHLSFVGVSVVYGANFIATIICIFCVKYNFVKHRTLLFVGTVMMLTSVLLLAAININVDSKSTHCTDTGDLINKLALSKLPFFIFGYAISFSGFTWLVNTELYPLCNRIKFGSFCVFAQWFSNFLISILVHNRWIQAGTTPLYFVCACMILICIGFIAKFIPETKGISLEFAVRAHNPGIIWIN
eukprot:221743_1